MLPAPSPILVLPHVVESLQKETLAQVSDFHKANPLLKGISKEELRKRLYDELPLEVFRHCLDGLAEKRKLAFLEDAVSLHGREVQLYGRRTTGARTHRGLLSESGLPGPFVF